MVTVVASGQAAILTHLDVRREHFSGWKRSIYDVDKNWDDDGAKPLGSPLQKSLYKSLHNTLVI